VTASTPTHYSVSPFLSQALVPPLSNIEDDTPYKRSIFYLEAGEKSIGNLCESIEK
jgi:hypothetical protein